MSQAQRLVSLAGRRCRVTQPYPAANSSTLAGTRTRLLRINRLIRRFPPILKIVFYALSNGRQLRVSDRPQNKLENKIIGVNFRRDPEQVCEYLDVAV